MRTLKMIEHRLFQNRTLSIEIKSLIIIITVSVALCQQCMKSKIKSVVEGDFKIIGLFPMGCSTPSNIDNRTIAWMEAVKYTINEVNKLHNKSIFGYVIYDTYDALNMDKTTFAVLDSLPYSSLSNSKDYNNICESNDKSCNKNVTSCKTCADLNEKVYQNKILGFVGPAESTNSIYVNQMMLPYKDFPIISYAATTLELDKRELYPNFFRTVSSDSYQADFISDLIKKTNSNYISVLWIDTEYGRGGRDQQKESFEKNGICIDYMDMVPNIDDGHNYTKSAMKLNNSASNVVVYWGTFKPLQKLLQETADKNLTNKVWIVSEAVGKNSFFFNYPNIFLVVQTEGEDPAFKNYFYNLNYENSSEWLRVVFEKYKVNENTSNFNVKNISEVFDLSKVLFVQNAVKVLIQSFFSYQNSLSLNQEDYENQSIDNRTMFLELLKQVNFSTLNEINFTFNSNHTPQSSYFELYASPNTSFLLIDKWSNQNSSYENRSQTKNDSLLLKIFSVCSIPCKVGKIKSGDSCCWTCIPCPDNSIDKNCKKSKPLYWNLESNDMLIHQVFTLLFSAIGVIISFFFIFTFIKKKQTPIVRSSNYEMTLIQMTMHLVMFILPLLAFGEETQEKCMARVYFGAVLHITILTVVLVKVKRLVEVFSLNIHCIHSKKQMFFIRSQIGLILLFFPCVFIALIFVVQKSNLKLYIYDEGNTPKYCDSDSFLVVYVCCVVSLSLLCGIQSFKARNLPWKYNENVYIAYALFLSCITLCVMLGLIKSNFDSNNKKFSYCLLMNISNFFLMVILFFNKIKIVWIYPEKNSRIEFYQNSFVSKYSNGSACSNVSNQNLTHTDSHSFNQTDAVDASSLATTDALSLATADVVPIATTDTLSSEKTDALSLASTDAKHVTDTDTVSCANNNAKSLANSTAPAIENTKRVPETPNITYI